MMKEMIRKVMEWCKLWNGEAATAKQADPSSDKREKEQAADNREVQDRLENYLWKHYEFRFNVLTEQPEYCAKGQGTDTPYKIVTQRSLNTLCLEAHRHRINCWDKDVSRLLHSRKVENYHPFLHYMSHLPQWDGVDRVTPLAVRISRKPMWVKGFHRWMLGVAAQWLGQAQDCANAVAPMLVSREQGKRKSSFCKILMPKELTPYYIDKFDLTSESGCEQKLSLFGLINMDEFDKYRAGQMPALKNLMQMASLSFIKSYQKSFSKLPRIASFAGTSNRKDILTDPSGSRRFICIEVEEKINTENIIHSQIYAQLKTELLRGKRYWFDSDEEAEINLHNREFYRQSTEESIFNCCFRAAQPDETYMELSAAEIFLCIKKRYPHALKQASPASFSKVLMSLGVERIHTRTGNLYRVIEMR